MDEPTCPATPPLSKCPDTPPRAGCSKSSPSIWNSTSDAKEKSRTPTPNRPSSPENCAICLGPLANKSFTNSCCHQFCFVCLLEWSKVKAECPLCKVAFDSIIHNVRSQDDYDQYHVVKEAPRATSIPSVVFWTHNRASMQYHFSEWMANRGLSRFRPVADSFRHTFIPDAIPPGPSQDGSYTVHVRRTPLGTSAFRRSIYDRDLWARLQPDVTGRYRECSAEFYSRNPAQMHRLIPFINRELNVLLESGARTAYVLEKILELLPLYNMTSAMFRSQVAQLIGHQHAPHFCHELRAFASSCYDMVGYDRAVQYHPNGGAGYSIEVDDIESDNNANTDDDDDDIQIIEPSAEPTASISRPTVLTSTATSGAAEMSVLDPGPSSSRGFSPVYRPSRSSVVHVSSSSDSDDPEDVQIVGYIKPRHERTPEVITLSSPEHPSPPSTSHYLAPSQASISRPESPDDLICINLGNNSSAEHKWQSHSIDDSSDDALYSLNGRPCEHYQGLRKSQSRKTNEDMKTVISSENSHSSFSSSDEEEDGKRRRRKRKHSKHKKTKKDHGRKGRKSSSSKRHKNNVISSDSEDMNQPSTSKGRPSRRRKSHNSSLPKSTTDLSPQKSLVYPSQFKSSAPSPVDSDCDNSPPRSTLRSAIVHSNHSRNSSSVQDDSSPARLSGPKLRNIVMTRTTTGEGHDSWRVADSRVSPDKHRAHGHRSSSHHSSKSPSNHKHYSSPQHSKHQAVYDSDIPLKKRRSSRNEKDSRCLQDIKSKRKRGGESRYIDLSSLSPKESSKPLAFSDDSSSSQK